MRLRLIRFAAAASFLSLLLLFTRPAAAQGFTYDFLLSEPRLPGLSFGAGALGDFDRDGRLDLLLTGQSLQGPTTQLFRFQRYGTLPCGQTVCPAVFVEPRPSMVGGGWYGASALADYDGDNDLDFVAFGAQHETAPYEAITRLYRNDGTRFTSISTNLPPLLAGAAAWGDYDNDGDLDLLLTGEHGETGRRFTEIYRNDGDDRFVATGPPLPDLAHSAAAWGDYDNDGALDLALAGAAVDDGFIAEIYRNDAGTFTPIGANLPGVGFGSLAWGDYDDDGDLDLLLAGAEVDPALYRGITQVYRNDHGTFVMRNLDLPGVFYGGARWGDFNNDGRLDIVLMGNTTARGADRIGRFYSHTGDGFEHVTNLVGIFLGNLTWGDVDGDHDLDLLTLGVSPDGQSLTSLYRNESRQVNQPPAAPEGLTAAVAGSDVILHWEAATDPETPSPGLTYNLRVGTEPEGTDVVTPMANVFTGRRWLPGTGNVSQNTQWTLRGLPAGTYYWSVQALDHTFTGSPFAEEGTFTISASGKTGTDAADETAVPARYALHAGYPNPFASETTLRVDLPEPADVTLRVHNVLGQMVRTLARGRYPAGTVDVAWDGRDNAGTRVSPGLYIFRLDAGSRTLSQRGVLVE